MTKVPSIEEYPSFLKNRLARRAAEKGEDVPEKIKTKVDDAKEIVIEATKNID